VIARSKLREIKLYDCVQKRIVDGPGIQWRELSVLATVERVDFDALVVRSAGHVGQSVARRRILEHAVSPRTVVSTIGHVGIWLKMPPVTPEQFAVRDQVWRN
jgi:hypothetical protein